MNRSTQKRVLAIVCCGAVIAAWPTFRESARGKTLGAGAMNPPASPPAQMANPARFAWQTFAAISRPTGPSPASGLSQPVAWEEWSTDADTFPDFQTSQQPCFPGNSQYPCAQASTNAAAARRRPLHPTTQQLILRGRKTPTKNLSAKATAAAGDQCVQNVEIVYRNLDDFLYIAQNNLWYLQGQEAKFNDPSFTINFPTTAIELKSNWVQLAPGVDQSRFHTFVQDGATYGLVALHLMSRELPNWFWATFEQVDNVGRCDYIGCHDSFGYTPADIAPNSSPGGTYPPGTITPGLQALLQGLGPEWQYYRLKGTQVDFTDAAGKPTLLGNSVTECGFVPSSSCITCHSRATVNGTGGRLSIFKTNTPPVSYNGQPEQRWFTNPNGSRKFLPMAFTWAFFQANAKPSAANTPKPRPK